MSYNQQFPSPFWVFFHQTHAPDGTTVRNLLMLNEDVDKVKEAVGVTGQLVSVDRVRLVVFGSGRQHGGRQDSQPDFSNKKALIVSLKEFCSDTKKGKKGLSLPLGLKMKQKKRGASVSVVWRRWLKI